MIAISEMSFILENSVERGSFFDFNGQGATLVEAWHSVHLLAFVVQSEVILNIVNHIIEEDGSPDVAARFDDHVGVGKVHMQVPIGWWIMEKRSHLRLADIILFLNSSQ